MAFPQQAGVDAGSLPPFPEGWFFVARREELNKTEIIEKQWMGVDIVVWQDDHGRVCVAEAYCPHLGSYLGPDAGGRICDGRLVCPFHGFEFDAAGQCVSTPFAAPPRSARLGVFETHEINGLIFAWWGIDGREPQWRLPDESSGLDSEDWSRPLVRTMRLRGHPQETTENAVDLAHLNYVHGFRNVEQVEGLSIDGPVLRTGFEFTVRIAYAGIKAGVFDIAAKVTIFGLGYSFVEVHERTIGMDTRLWTLATPIDGTHIDLTLISQVRQLTQPRRRFMGMAFLPTALRTHLLNCFALSQEWLGVRQDRVIWRRKRYRSRPRLCRADGEIMAYRAYCAQFYPQRNEPERLPDRQIEPIRLATS